MSFRINLDTLPEHSFCSDDFFARRSLIQKAPGSAGAKYCVPLRPGRIAATVRCAVRPLESGRLHRQELAHLPPGPRARRPCAQGRERHDHRLCRPFCALVGAGRRSARGRRPGADTVSAAELRPRDQRVRVALGGDLPGPLMQLRRMLKPDGLLSRLAHGLRRDGAATSARD